MHHHQGAQGPPGGVAQRDAHVRLRSEPRQERVVAEVLAEALRVGHHPGLRQHVRAGRPRQVVLEVVGEASVRPHGEGPHPDTFRLDQLTHDRVSRIERGRQVLRERAEELLADGRGGSDDDRPQRRLGPPPFGDVPGDAENPPRDAVRAAQEADPELHPDRGAVLAHDLDLERPSGGTPVCGVLLQPGRAVALHLLHGLRREQPLEGEMHRLLDRVAGEALHGRGDVRDPEMKVRGPDDVHDVVGHQPVPGLALPERGLGASPLGDVAEAPDPTREPAVLALRLRIALEHAPVLELEHVETLGARGLIQGMDLVEELLRCGELVEHGGERERVVPRRHDRLGYPPHLDELAVVAGDLPLPVHHQDAVGGGIQDGAVGRGGSLEPRPGGRAMGGGLARHGRQVDAFRTEPLAFNSAPALVVKLVDTPS